VKDVNSKNKASAAQFVGNFPTGIGKPATRALHGSGIEQLEELSTRSEAEIKALHGMGPKTLELLRIALSAVGLSFRP
jgi:hypothetical protein